MTTLNGYTRKYVVHYAALALTELAPSLTLNEHGVPAPTDPFDWHKTRAIWWLAFTAIDSTPQLATRASNAMSSLNVEPRAVLTNDRLLNVPNWGKACDVFVPLINDILARAMEHLIYRRGRQCLHSSANTMSSSNNRTNCEE